MLSIRARLVLLALIAVVPLGFDRMQSLEASRSEQIHVTHVQTMELARRGADAHTEAVKAAHSLLQVLARTEAIDQGLRSDCRLLSASETSMPWLRSLSLADASGRIVCSTLPLKAGLDVSRQPFFRAAAGNKPILSDYLVGPISRQPTILAAQPVRTDNGPVRAVLIATLDLHWMDGLVDTVASRSGAAISLINGNGTLIAHHGLDSQHPIAASVADHPTVGTIMTGVEGEVLGPDIDGVRRIGAFVRMPSTDSRLIVGFDEARVLSRIDQQIGRAYLQFAMFIAVALLATWIGGERLIVGPIRSLAQAVTRLGRGDLDARMPQQGWVAEFVPLASAFDDMARRLAMRERELRAANRHYEELASRDALSGLANRRAFDDRLTAEWRRATADGRPLGLLLFDVDHFKAFNDHCGHLEGDTCLRQVGEALASVATGPEDFAARYGGDEFALLLPGADEPQAIARAERLREAVGGLNEASGGSRGSRLTISIGAASIVPGANHPPEALIAAADMGLYAAKGRGRDTIVGHAAVTLAPTG